MADSKKAHVIMEKYGAKNVRILAEVAGATPSRNCVLDLRG